jgi:DNA-binding MarR family transcriptional regulator
MPTNLSLAEYQALAEFRSALRHFLRFSETAAQKAKLTPQQHQALLAVKGYPGGEAVTIGELAERLQLRHHSTVELVDRMAKMKLLRRERSGTDRREVFVQLTARGERVLANLSTVHRKQLEQLGPKLHGLLKALGEG